MEKRKLQATGGASLTLTLPKAWTNQWNLGSKDEVVITARGPALVIKPASLKSQNQMAIDIAISDQPDEWLYREIIGAYIAGADTIRLTGDQISASQSQRVRQAVQLLFGFEIIEESAKKIIAHNIRDESKFMVAESTLTCFATVRAMFQDALSAAKTGDRHLAAGVQQRDIEVNMFAYTTKRQCHEIINGKIDGGLATLYYYRGITTQLERIADHAVKIAELAAASRTHQVKLSMAFPLIQDRVTTLFDEVETVVKSRDKQLAQRILDGGDELEQLVYSSKRLKQSYEGAIVEDSLDRLRGYLMNIAELTIDYSFVR